MAQSRIVPGRVDCSVWGVPFVADAIPAVNIRVGDDVIGYFRHGRERPVFYPHPCVVQLADLPRVRLANNGVLCDNFSAVGKVEPGMTVEYWLVTAFGSAQPVPVAKTSDPWPHKCPNCGQKAYVGFLQVEHASGTQCQTRG